MCPKTPSTWISSQLSFELGLRAGAGGRESDPNPSPSTAPLAPYSSVNYFTIKRSSQYAALVLCSVGAFPQSHVETTR